MTGPEDSDAAKPTRIPPIVTPDAKFFWDGADRGEFLGQKCGDCDRFVFPPRPMCPFCHSLNRQTVPLTGRGTVHAWTIPRHPAPFGFREPPVVAVIELEEGIRFVSNVVGVKPEDMTMDMPVEVTFEATMKGHQVPVFRPRAETGAVARTTASAVAPPSASQSVPPSPAARARDAGRQPGAAVVGLGATEFSKESGRSELQLAAECSLAACEDAGVDARDIDGMITFTIDNSDEVTLARCLGVKDLAYTARIPGGGAAAAATLYQAMALVDAGLCRNVLIWRAMNERSQYRFGQNPTNMAGYSAGNGTGSLLWCVPFGAMTPASWGALQGQRYMHRYGLTNLDLGHVSVLERKYAATNPKAWFYQKPITLDDHQNSKWIQEPVLRLLDCCQESDGGVAILVTSLERARDLKQPPVKIAGACQSIPYNVEVISNYYHDDLTIMPEAWGTAKRLYAQTGLKPADMQAAMIYDAFTPQVLMQLEAFGFCGKGEGADFVRSGALELDGVLPTNTHGGLLGEAYIHGMNSMAEGVRQVRGSAVNQVTKGSVDHVLVSSGMAGAILERV